MKITPKYWIYRDGFHNPVLTSEEPKPPMPSEALYDQATVDRLQRQNAELLREIREIERDARREIQDAVAEARWQAQQGDEYGSW